MTTNQRSKKLREPKQDKYTHTHTHPRHTMIEVLNIKKKYETILGAGTKETLHTEEQR